MAKTTRSDATWIEIDPSTLDAGIAAGYKAYKDKYAAMKAARTAFEEALADEAGVPEGKRMVFGYNFGKLSVAIVDDDRKAAKPQAAKLTLSQFMSMAKEQGRRT